MQSPWGREKKRGSLISEYTGRLGTIIPRHRAEIALLAAKQEAEAANRSKSEFLAHISHELRTPLNAILGFSEIISENVYGDQAIDKYRDYARDIHKSGEHLLSIISEILELSKIEVGKLQLNLESLELQDVIQDCVTLFREPAKQANIELTCEVDSDLLPIAGDRKRLHQMLLNLLSNAMKFTLSDGKVAVSCYARDDGRILLQVKDSGIGMRPEDVPVALQPFRQVEHYLTRHHEGTGLGLPLAKAFAELHKAEFAITSELEVGTDIQILFPASRRKSVRQTSDASAKSSQTVSTSKSAVDGVDSSNLHAVSAQASEQVILEGD